jgi:exosortase
MPSNLNQPPEGKSADRKTPDIFLWISLVVAAGVIYWFYNEVPRYGIGRTSSAIDWIRGAWNDETDYEHGILFSFIIVGLIIYRFKDLKTLVSKSDLRGLAVVFLGVLFYVIAYRTLQPRIAMGSLPIVLFGSAWYLWGWRVAKMVAFPLFLFWLAVPLPGFQQATTHLQLLATAMAHHGSALFGVETYVEGTKVLPIKGNWKPLDIAAGCSGIRSLMALLMISAVWAYIAKISMWKKFFLFLLAFPLAILGNALRVISIFVIAEYGDAKWAAGTWHDWSGLLLFYPFSLMALLVAHSLLEGGLPWKKAKQRELRRSTVVRKQVTKSALPE